MAGKSKYVELVFPVSPSIPRHSLAGYELVSDYIADGQRHLFLKRRESAPAPRIAKKAKVAAPAPSPATAFPPPNAKEA